MVRSLAAAITLAAIAVALSSEASAAVVTVGPVRDNTLFQDAEGDTSNGAGPACFAGNNGQNLVRRALVMFDLSGALPSGAEVDSVVLTLQVSSTPDTFTRRFTLHRVLGDWGEGRSYSAGGAGAPATPGDATWLHTFYPGQFWACAGGDFDPVVSASEVVGDVGPYVWTGPGMAADVQQWLGQPTSNFGWLIRGEETGPRTVRRFDSRESGEPARRPALTIFYSTPVATRSVSWGSLKARFR
jgi:hypothetical protein